MKVLISPEVERYFSDLSIILWEKDYFSFYADAERYVKDLIKDVKTNLPTKTKRPAPAIFRKNDDSLEYASFTKNRRTTWYVFFKTYQGKEEIIYLVKRIENNHTAAQYM
jgi:hypothetical protein